MSPLATGWRANRSSWPGTTSSASRASRPAQPFAEKIHAYTFPWRDRPNTRVRDLVDLVLLIDTGLLEPAATVTALRLTFARRATHPLPAELPPPPEGWATPFAALAEEVALVERTVEAAFAYVAVFYTALTNST